MRGRWLVALVGVVALGASIVGPASVAAAGAPHRVVVAIKGGDQFVHPGLLTNDYSFPKGTITVAQGGRITFVNETTDGHIIALVRAGDVPTTTAQVDSCPLCDAVNGAFFTDPTSKNPTVAQLDAGKNDAETTPDDSDAPDLGAIKSAGGQLPPGIGPVLIEDFDTPSHGTTVGDATIVGTGGAGGPSQRTIVVTAAPGLYHFICTLHPWMQGTIRVVG